MCGIFGLIVTPNAKLSEQLAYNITKSLFIKSESRGKESSGIALKNSKTAQINVLKKSIPASELVESKAYHDFMNTAMKGLFDSSGKLQSSFALCAHARLVTNGSQENNNNNQPVIKDHLVAVHNGIITNVEKLWADNIDLDRSFEVDTEVLLALIQKLQSKNADSIAEAVHSTFNLIQGTASTCILDSRAQQVILATNNASLYFTVNPKLGILIFASEKFILETCIEELELKQKLDLKDVAWSKPFSAYYLNLDSFSINEFKLDGDFNAEIKSSAAQANADEIVNHSKDKPIDFEAVKRYHEVIHHSPERKLLEFNLEAVNQLKRCKKCLLPETFPFIAYDNNGECNYCKRYVVKRQGSKEQEFKELMKTYRSKDGKPDCIIPFSGGRDSSYGMHYIVHELGLNPITYTYDWGMVTDLARRNIARVCGKLGIENIIVSADISKKRRNIKLNVEAWLKKPQLGMIPLFMAGDKQFFYYVNQIKRQTGIKLDIWSTNILENTDFKVGFCGISPSFDKTRPDYLPLSSKIGLAWYYGKNFLTNPGYLNASLVDTVASFYSYYAEPRTHFYQLFDWIKWDEKHIEQTLFNEYDWEVSPDTTTTWRIGDGTAAFYNYVYYTVAGFSEFDTFRSNQIREGLITREQGLHFINQENRPRFESMKWYFETIGVDFAHAIKVVNQIPKLYKTA